MTDTAAAAKSPGTVRVGVQKFGTFLSGMIMPNIAAFIAWGLITALFIDTGWLGNSGPIPAWRWADSAMLGGGTASDGTEWIGLVSPIITYLLPLLIAFTGGNVVYGHRGGVVGAVAAFGVIIGAAGTVMFLGAMVAGPVAALILKQVEKLWAGKVRAGFEMLVDNFSAGFVAFFTALAAFFWLAPAMKWLTDLLGAVVGWLVDTGLIPLASIIVEPAKVLFLNNAINHGVFTPIGSEQATETGRSLLFLVEANPGPGAGLLLAIALFGVGAARATAPGAWIIQFLGGIHEVYFPYVLAKPILLLGLIAGGATGVLTNVIFQSGLVAPASPGSIFAVLIQTAPGSHLGVILSVILSAGVTFLVSMLFLLGSRKRDLAAEAAGADGFASAVAQTEANKGRKSSVLGGLVAGGTATATKTIQKVVFACDAGMGSSAMGASVLRNKFKAAGIEGVTVTNKAIAALDGTADLVVTQQQLTERAQQREQSALHVSVDNFMNSPRYDEITRMLLEQQQGGAAEPVAAEAAPAAPAATDSVLAPERVRIHAGSVSRDEALREAADMLQAAGAVTGAYYDAMLAREQTVSTYMGNELAIPHGTNEAKDAVLASALTVVRYDGGVDWDGETATFVVGIAGKGDEHLSLLSNVATLFSDDEQIAKLKAAATPEELYALLQTVNEG
ncbi:PTS mannitol transporter subunit IICBA [Microbacterium sediminis]|uniref:Mannitol-specific phosphotransferase enzyme IIA component n=1 Tax=Microbacterium sediminis TaxID=904291 RepID=A0A1B9NCF1_9MICO|nr:PTS mannitol transporter subunit IICBA [Microbacterium sediminis]OCG74276.1 PTS mannose transporter subunit IIA [Microbacterium sediminis]QBR73637.1 PTS mannitol transporter subunit IICBA [Microbacterium sediminis]